MRAKASVGAARFPLATLLTLALLTMSAPPAGAEVDTDILGSGPGRFNSIVAEDIDDDGRVELIAGNYEGYLNILEYDDGEFVPEWRSDQWGHRLWGVEYLDVDGDGGKELVTGDGDGTVRILDGKSRKVKMELKDVGRDAHGLAVGEMGDGDDTPELFVGTGYKTDNPWGNVEVFNGVTGEKEAELGPFDSRIRGIEVADLDGDGTMEVVFGSGVSLGETPGEGYLYIYSYDEAEGGYVEEWKSPDLDGCVEGVKVADLNGDGGPEIIASNGYRYREGYIYVFAFSRFEEAGGERTPVYRELWQSPDIGPKVYGLAVGDIDDDGHMEIVAGTNEGYVYIYEAPSWKKEWQSDDLGKDVLGIALQDVDGDGDMEIIACEGGYNGKADFTSGYSTPHIYIIDGTTHDIEEVVGQIDYLKIALQVTIILLIIIFLFGLRARFRGKAVARKLPMDDRRGVSR
jgi:WD40 repeat protein